MGISSDMAVALETILKQSDKEGFEIVVSSRATLAGYEGYWIWLDRFFGNWAAADQRASMVLLADFPMLWLNEQLTGDPEYSQTGIGILDTSAMRQLPTGADLDRWRDSGDIPADLVRGYEVVAVPELHSRFPLFAKHLLKALSVSLSTLRCAETGQMLTAIGNVIAPASSASVVMLGCWKRTEPSVGSADGLEPMMEAVCAKLADANATRQFSVIVGEDALRVERRGGVWTLLERRDTIFPPKGRYLPLVWIRTGASATWNAIDTNGFGIVLDDRDPSFVNGLMRRISLSRRTRVPDTKSGLYAGLYELLCCVSNIPRTRRPAGGKFQSGVVSAVCRALASSDEVTLWCFQ